MATTDGSVARLKGSKTAVNDAWIWTLEKIENRKNESRKDENFEVDVCGVTGRDGIRKEGFSK